ncbi:MAG: hypothetical protein M3O91_06975 [Chloroflexota bacterium]|nr:hypothetical protein [Chloroflexota bacterium]
MTRRPLPAAEAGHTPRRTELIGIADAVAEFGISRATVHRWLVGGKVKKYTRAAGRQRVFLDRRELQKLFEPTPQRGRKAK